jgi:uncharacterized protein YneF (UPF0154 family)
MTAMIIALCLIGGFLAGFFLGCLYSDRLWRKFLYDE